MGQLDTTNTKYLSSAKKKQINLIRLDPQYTEVTDRQTQTIHRIRQTITTVF